jgi:hypothetical protein
MEPLLKNVINNYKKEARTDNEEKTGERDKLEVT